MVGPIWNVTINRIYGNRILGRGFYKIGMENGKKVWQKHMSSDPLDHIAWFVGCLSNSCFEYLVQRQGRDSINSLEGGIGLYLDHPFETVNI